MTPMHHVVILIASSGFFRPRSCRGRTEWRSWKIALPLADTSPRTPAGLEAGSASALARARKRHMTNREKWLYHQLHPVKLLVDWGAGLISLYPLWRHELVA